ncbi:MAG: beta-N-acetylhexosaminidase [Lachnospiraceae bacterium]|nr:beta-N-acetylhexosaminidase [Lachnospiraceae bacterium]
MLKLVTYPGVKVENLPGNCILPRKAGICTGPFSNNSIAAFSERCGIENSGPVFLTLRCNKKLPAEGYILEISEKGITVEASCEQGVIWALTTVANLLDDGKLPCCRIEDAPKYSHRGISLDCARHFFPAKEVKRIINTMSLAKLNVLHWHLSDDQGWRIESRKFPRLQEVSEAYFTQDEIRDVVQYAALRGVEIIPEIDLPGHTSGILAAYPEYSCSGREVNLAACGGIYPVILCAGKEKTSQFLKELLAEITKLFPGSRFHISGDEAPKSEWKKCPHCQARMRELGITSYEDLQADFSRRVSDILKSLGKQTICWNETLRADTPPEDIQIQYWTLQYRDTRQNACWVNRHILNKIFTQQKNIAIKRCIIIFHLFYCKRLEPFFQKYISTQWATTGYCCQIGTPLPGSCIFGQMLSTNSSE